MTGRLLIVLTSVAAFVCTAVLVYLMAQLDRTQRMLRADSVVEFNDIQRNALASALRDYRFARLQDLAAPHDSPQRFDIVRSAFTVSDAHRGSLVDMPATAPLIADTRAFLERTEPLVTLGAELSDTELERVIDRASDLSRRIYELGVDVYQRKGRLRDDIAFRMARLTHALWFFGATLLLAGVALFALLARAYRHASALVAESSATQAQLATVLEELTDGDIERRKQNRFIATASHDLRQPLHALGLNLVTLRGHVSGPAGERILENASRSTQALNQLLGSVLDVSRLDAEVIEVKPDDLSLDDIFEQIHHTWLPEAGGRGLALDVHLAGLVVHTDRVLLGRILGNLISNALRYTETGSVTLEAERATGGVLVSVADTGPGIPERERDAVFEEYYQLDSAEGHRSQGLGLGLSIVHRIARLLGIRLEVHSVVGRGTRFELLLPEGDALAPERRRVAESDTAFDGVHFDGLCVLVIDDDRDIRDGMHRLLEQRSCEVLVAESAEEALAAIVAEEIVPDLVVADYRLRGDRTGADAIRAVCEEVNEDVPAMIVTGDTSPARLREASASGFRLLNKPIVPEELFDAIGELAGRRD